VALVDLRFKEIEHKYIVDERFDFKGFRQSVKELTPNRSSKVHVKDRYYLTERGRLRRFLFRHRYDKELHNLTIKSLETDTEVRAEVNLDLGQHAGNQEACVDAFLDQLGIVWSGTLEKDLEAWYFPSCEIVYYEASTESRTVRCVEFEATQKTSLQESLAVLEHFEFATGFHNVIRSHRSLPQILFPDLVKILAKDGNGVTDC